MAAIPILRGQQNGIGTRVLTTRCEHAWDTSEMYALLVRETERNRLFLRLKHIRENNTGLFKMIVGGLTTCHTQYT